MRSWSLVLIVGVILAAGGAPIVLAQVDPFPAMNAVRVAPPQPLPDVTFIGLDGRPARLDALHGRPVLLTFFTTW